MSSGVETEFHGRTFGDIIAMRCFRLFAWGGYISLFLSFVVKLSLRSVSVSFDRCPLGDCRLLPD